MSFTTNNSPALGRLRAYVEAAHRHSLEKRRVRELHFMSDRMLTDVGVTREEALRAQPRPFRDFIY